MTVGWGIIGTGRVHKLMAAALKESEDTGLLAVMGRTQAAADDFAKVHGIERAYGSLDDLLHNPEVDVVYVGSPNNLHCMHAVKAAEAGKHVLCEKPMSLSLKECRSIIETCGKHGVKLGMGLQYRHHPAHLKAREIVASGELGQLNFVKIQTESPPEVLPKWYYEAGVAGGGVLYMYGTHRLDLLRFVLGREVEEVSAFIGEHTEKRPFEEIAVGMLRFGDDLYGTAHFCLNIPHGTNGLEVHGSKGSLFCINTTGQWWGGGGGELIVKNEKGDHQQQFPRPNLYRKEIEDFNRCIKPGGAPAATGMDGLRTAAICIGMFESGRQEKTIKIEDLRRLG
ncbi:MAG: Gfo/Idh/MocA family oxidoreductase [Deltaproteobacteria bacterium]|nr:Gfo/Idh/MocA family oxidoreductase [Deltaproteobacteria bacterium]